MNRYAARRVGELAPLELRGDILKKDSPSCGMERVPVYDQNGMPRRDGRGLFAIAMLELLPELPIEEEGRLHDLPIRPFLCPGSTTTLSPSPRKNGRPSRNSRGTTTPWPLTQAWVPFWGRKASPRAFSPEAKKGMEAFFRKFPELFSLLNIK